MSGFLCTLGVLCGESSCCQGIQSEGHFYIPFAIHRAAGAYNAAVLVSEFFWIAWVPLPVNWASNQWRDMKPFRISGFLVIALLFVLGNGIPAADGQRWPPTRKEPIEVRLIALAEAYPRTSFFANDEVFIAEQELGKEESRFIKLVYDFLPYQPPLSSYGLDYSLVHIVHAVRDTACDESLWEMRSLQQQKRQSHATPTNWKYALESPINDLDRRQARLRCYRTTSDDYEKALNQPTNQIPY